MERVDDNGRGTDHPPAAVNGDPTPPPQRPITIWTMHAVKLVLPQRISGLVEKRINDCPIASPPRPDPHVVKPALPALSSCPLRTHRFIHPSRMTAEAACFVLEN